MRSSFPSVINLTPALVIATLLLTGCPAENGGADNPDGRVGDICMATSECGSGFVCIAGTCGTPNTVNLGGRCSATRDCVSGLYCSSQTGRCDDGGGGRVGDACISDKDCTAGLRCDYASFHGFCGQAGQTDLGDGCTRNSDCIAGLQCGFVSGAVQCNIPSLAFPKFDGVSCAEDTSPFHSYFEVPRASRRLPDFYRLPYPNDIRVTTTGNQKTVDLSDFPRPGPTHLGADLARLYAEATAEDFDGFGAVMPVAFRFSQGMDAPVGSARYFNLTTGQEHGSHIHSTTSRSLLSCRFFVYVSVDPYQALQPGHQYLVILMRPVVKASTGESPVQDPDLVAVLGAARPTGDEELARAWDVYAPARQFLTDRSIPVTDVANAALFTVGDATGHMQRLAAAVTTQPAPVISELFQCGVSTGAAPCDDGTDARRCGAASADFHEIHGKMRMPIYQRGTPPYLTPNDGGELNETGGVVSKVRDEEVCFALTLPKATTPAAGWPLVVFSHATGGSFRSFIDGGIAGELATASTPAAVLSFDNVGHGARRGSSNRRPEELVFNVLNPKAARDNHLQGAADILTALKITDAQVPGSWSGPTIRFDGKRVVFGHSQGATHTSLAAPFTDAAPAIVLAGAGANLAKSLLTRTSPADVSAGLIAIFREELDRQSPIMTIWANYFDRIEPMIYNRLIAQNPPTGRSAKHVFMVWGQNDTFTPQETQEDTVISLNAPVAAPVLFKTPAMPGPAQGVARPVRLNYRETVTSAVFQYNPSGYDGHLVAFRNDDARRDWKAFIVSFFATGTPSVP